MAKGRKAVSPVNGQPVPTTRKTLFTSETAREARAKRTAKEKAQKSIKAAFLEYMGTAVTEDSNGNKLTGAQAIAFAVIKGAMKGSAEMVKIALALTGETPATKVEISNGQLADLIDGLKDGKDVHAEAASITGGLADKPAPEN